jgi:hypothetical protein
MRHRLLRTAKLARALALAKELESLFYLVGLLHDIGKFQHCTSSQTTQTQEFSEHVEEGSSLPPEFASKLGLREYDALIGPRQNSSKAGTNVHSLRHK